MSAVTNRVPVAPSGAAPSPDPRDTGRDSRRAALAWARRDPIALAALVLLAAIVVACAAAPLLTPYDPLAQDLGQRLQAPSAAHPFGTDEFGRDLLSRILYGGRLSLVIGFVSVGLGLLVGVPLGLVAGFFRRWDMPIMRVMDVLFSFPRLLLAIALVAALGPGLLKAMLAVGIGTIPIFARLTRATVLVIRELDYVLAARATGAREGWLLVRHVLPNALTPVIVYATLNFGQAILIAAFLSFLGLGVLPPDPEWGAIVDAGRKYLRQAPWLTFIPGLVIFAAVLCFNVLGDSLRDLLDPRLRRV